MFLEMRAARWVLFTTVAVLGCLWAAAWTSSAWAPGEDDKGAGLFVVAGFALGHAIALVLAITAVILAARSLRIAATARTRSGYVTLAASGLIAAFITIYLGFFVGLWGA